ncbi:MAG TPA: zf-HC2 domain-containing protein [Chloroflexota bacterium]|nr:zf-HC2 domain-containing protein [Chloroflexota bacterium]
MAINELTCQELVELVTEYLEGTLATEAKRRFEAHLASCAACTTYLAQMRQTIAMTGQLREDDLAPPARDKLLDLFRRWKAS